MICPNDLMQMHQKARIGDGEAGEAGQASWMLHKCPVCGIELIEFHAVLVVGDSEEARLRGGLLIARAMEKERV